MTKKTLHPDTTVGPANLIVSNLDRSVHFYTETLGFIERERQGDTAILTANGKTAHLLLTEHPGARPKPPHTTGLYHIAILVPNRAALARALRRLVEQRYRLGGSSDHWVSEALYLSDPDGNGLEIYRDRPQSEWQRGETGLPLLGRDRLDVEKLYLESLDDQQYWTGLDPETRIGHVHLQVADLPEATKFYVDVPPAPADAVGLRIYDIIVPDAVELERVAESLRSAQVPFETSAGRIETQDPFSNALRFVVAGL
jgi:catechol 2,3-dioxygenase